MQRLLRILLCNPYFYSFPSKFWDRNPNIAEPTDTMLPKAGEHESKSEETLVPSGGCVRNIQTKLIRFSSIVQFLIGTNCTTLELVNDGPDCACSLSLPSLSSLLYLPPSLSPSLSPLVSQPCRCCCSAELQDGRQTGLVFNLFPSRFSSYMKRFVACF